MISGGRSQISPCPNGSSISRAPRAGGVKPVDTVSGRLRGIFAEMDGERQAYKVREAAHLSPGRFSKNRGFRCDSGEDGTIRSGPGGLDAV